MRVLACLALCAVLAVPAGVAAQGSAPPLTRIEFRGNVAVPDDSLSRAIRNQETRCRSFVLAPFCAFGVGFSLNRQSFNRRELPGDIVRLQGYYGSRGYREARVDTLLTRHADGTVEITFQIDEGRPVRVTALAVEGIETLEALDLDADLPIGEGDLLSSIALDAARDTLIQRLQNRGYPRADVLRTSFIPSATPYDAVVTFDVDAGPHAVFGPVTLDGNLELSDRVIRRLLPFREGEEFSEARRLEAQRNLFSIEMIQHAAIVETADPAGVFPDSVIPLTVQITEGDIHRVRTGAGWSTSDCVNGEGRWTSRNFFGGARRLQIRARASNLLSEELHDEICGQSGVDDFGGLNWLVSADFSQPWIFGRQFSLGTSLFFERQSLQDVFVRQAVGVDLSVTQSLGRSTSLQVAYRPQLTRLEAAEVFFCTTFLVCTPDDISTIQDPNWLAPLAVSLVRDRSNSILNPTRGYRVLLNVEHASTVTGSDFEYSRVFAEVATYHQARNRQVVALRLRGGWVGAGSFSVLGGGTDIIHPQKRFYGGGANSVRGFAQNQMGPRVLTIDVSRLLSSIDGGDVPLCEPEQMIDLTCDANPLRDGAFDTPRPTGGRVVLEGSVEYRVGVSPRVEAAMFADFGRIWAESGSGDVSRFEISPGVGVRYMSPIGPIRVDLGYRFQDIENLQVVTSQIRPFDPARDDEADKIRRFVGGVSQVIDFVLKDELAVLGPSVAFGPAAGFSFARLQLHLSIGQAF